MNTYVVEATDKVSPETIRCIPNAPLRSGGTAITLCGWVDVSYREETGEPTCVDCLEIVAYCKGLELRS